MMSLPNIKFRVTVKFDNHVDGKAMVHYSEDLNLYMAGSINQVDTKIKPFILMGRVMKAIQSRPSWDWMRNDYLPHYSSPPMTQTLFVWPLEFPWNFFSMAVSPFRNQRSINIHFSLIFCQGNPFLNAIRLCFWRVFAALPSFSGNKESRGLRLFLAESHLIFS